MSSSTSNELNFISPTTAKLEIENFSAQYDTKNIEFVLQNNDKIKFSLNCYCNYVNPISGYIFSSIYLYLHSGDKDSVTVRFRMTISNGGQRETRVGLANFQTNHESRRYGGQFEIDPNNAFLINNKFTIYCEVEEIGENVNAIQNQEANKGFPNNQIVQDYQSLLEEAKFSDASLIVAIGEKRLMVHKAILSARSKVFAAMFENDCEEKRKNRVEIIDISAEVIEQMLVYIYTGKIPDLAKYAADLFVAADKYQLEHLKTACEQYLVTKLEVESAANTLLVADMHHAELLKTKAIDFIVDNATKVMATEGWKALLKSRIELVVDLFQKIAIKTNR